MKTATIQETLTERRKELGLSQREVGRRAGFSSSAMVNLLEAEKHEPTLSTLIRWCAALELVPVVRGRSAEVETGNPAAGPDSHATG